MDVTALRNRIEATLDSNADIRRQAELDLKYVGSAQRHFVTLVIQIEAHTSHLRQYRLKVNLVSRTVC